MFISSLNCGISVRILHCKDNANIHGPYKYTAHTKIIILISLGVAALVENSVI